MFENIIKALPLLICLFWFIILATEWRKQHSVAKMKLCLFMAVAAVLYYGHYVFFNHLYDLMPYMDTAYVMANLAVFPLYHLYLKEVTQAKGGLISYAIWLAPSVVAGIGVGTLYLMMDEEETRSFLLTYLYGNRVQGLGGLPIVQAYIHIAARVVFALLILPILVIGFRNITQYNRSVDGYFSDTIGKKMYLAKKILVLFVVASVISFVANIIGREIFDTSLWLVLIPAMLFSALIFLLGYEGHVLTYTMRDVLREEGEETTAYIGRTEKETAEVLNREENKTKAESGDEGEAENEDIDTDVIEELRLRIEEAMKRDRLFLKSELKVSDVADYLSSNREYVYQAINVRMGISFTEYINRMRVEYAIKLMKDNPETKTHNLYLSAGFNSPASFYRNFKTVTGMSPQQFLRRIKAGIIIILFPFLAYAQTNAPFCIDKNLFDAKERNTLGLDYAPKAETVTVFCPSDSSDHYANGVVMAEYKGRLYCMWQSSAKDEDSPDTWVACSHSDDEGKTWSRPQRLCETDKDYFCTSGGWLSCDNRLVAYINVWRNDSILKACSAYYTETTDGTKWSALKEVKWADGTAVNGIFEQDPHRIDNGRIIGAVHLMPGMMLAPIYTNDSTGREGWHRGDFNATPNGKQSAELEPSFFVQKDGTLVMTMRDQRSSYRVLAATSNDNGETWSDAKTTNMPDSRAKQCAGNLSDGTAFIVNNPISEKKPRTPLVITLSYDGKNFNKAYLLRSGEKSDLPTQCYQGKYKTIGYSYPKAMEHNGWLYVSYSTNKERVEYTRVRIKSGNEDKK